MLKFVHFLDVAGKEVAINVQAIRQLSIRNSEHVNVQFDSDHIQVVRGTLPDVMEQIKDAS